jgi:hypothetical protein
MKSAGALTSRARTSHAPGASVAAMLIVAIACGLAAAQSSIDTTTS